MRAGVVLPEQAHLRQPGLADDRVQIRDHRLEREVGDVPLRMPGPPPVVVDQREPLRQLPEDPVQKRVLPFHPDIAEWHPRNENHRGPIAGHRERQTYPIRAAGITNPRNGPHRPTLSSGYAHDQDPSAGASRSDLAAPPAAPPARAGRKLSG